MPSFDIVSEVNMQEVDNAVQQAAKEVKTRYDFRNSKCELTREDTIITILADDEYKLNQVLEILKVKLIRREVDPKVLDYAKLEKASHDMVRQKITVRQGIDTDMARKLVKTIKESKIRVQAAIQDKEVRVTSKQRDDLQAVITLVRGEDFELPLQYINFRD